MSKRAARRRRSRHWLKRQPQHHRRRQRFGWEEGRLPSRWSCPYEARALAVAALAHFAARPLLASSSSASSSAEPMLAASASGSAAAIQALAVHFQATLAPPDPRLATNALSRRGCDGGARPRCIQYHGLSSPTWRLHPRRPRCCCRLRPGRHRCPPRRRPGCRRC